MTGSLVPLLIPMVGPPGPWTDGAAFHHHPHPFGGIMFLLTTLLIIGLVVAAKRGKLGPPPWLAGGPGRIHSPEWQARQILAERFAKGDISSDEFLERASVLNWTPGSEAFPPQPGRKNKKR